MTDFTIYNYSVSGLIFGKLISIRFKLGRRCTGRGWMIRIFSIIQIHFCFLLIECHCTFSIFYKMLTNYVYYYCMLIRVVLPSGFLFSLVPALFLSILSPLFLPSSSVSLYYFTIAVPYASVWENTRA